MVFFLIALHSFYFWARLSVLSGRSHTYFGLGFLFSRGGVTRVYQFSLLHRCVRIPAVCEHCIRAVSLRR